MSLTSGEGGIPFTMNVEPAGTSNNGNNGGMMEHVEMMMDEAETDEQREEIRRFKKKLESMR